MGVSGSLTILEARGLWKLVENTWVLRGVELVAEEGMFIVVRGRSGVGKTTLARILALLDKPDKGSLHLMGCRVDVLSDKARAELRLRYIGYVDQFYTLIPSLTVVENVELPLALMGVERSERRRAAIELLEALGLGDKLWHKPWQLSGGERQRVAIARALAKKPRLLVLDEPLSNLDDRTASTVLKLIREYLESTGASAVMMVTDLTTDFKADLDYTLVEGVLRGGKQR